MACMACCPAKRKEACNPKWLHAQHHMKMVANAAWLCAIPANSTTTSGLCIAQSSCLTVFSKAQTLLHYTDKHWQMPLSGG